MIKTKLAEQIPKNCKEVYSIINARQVTALMFHDQMADYFDFLGLRGFKRLHEYQYLAESMEHRAIKRYYLNHHNALLPEDEIESIDIIPDDWYQYTRMDVTPAVRKQSIQSAMTDYRQWETETKALYERLAGYLISWNMIADFNKVNDLIKDVDTELKYLERLCIDLKAVDYDPSFVEILQDKYHEKYKEKCKELGVDIC